MSLKFKREKRLIKSLKLNLFVRVALSMERIAFLTKLRENGEEYSEPIWITEDGTVIDGRHRINVEQSRGAQDIECKVFAVTDRIELIAMAYKANAKGSLQPNTRDTEHTIMALMNAKCPEDKIAHHLELPLGWCRSIFKRIKAAETRRKLISAEAMLINNKRMTLASAASKAGVTSSQLQEYMASRGKKRAEDVNEFKRRISNMAKSHNITLSGMYARAMDRYRDGEIDEGFVNELVVQLNRLGRKYITLVANWEKRLKALMSGEPDPGEPEQEPEDLPPRKAVARKK